MIVSTTCDPAVLAVTPNPAIDRTATVEELRFDTVLRPERLVAQPGGKGINVARALTRLGTGVRTTGFAGGFAGQWLVARLEEEGLAPAFVEIAGETRTTYSIVDGHGRSVLVYEKGPEVDDDDVARLLGMLDELPASELRAVVVSGSMPQGAGAGACGRLVQRCGDRGLTSLVDTTGAALRQAVAAGASIVKVNVDEAIEAGFGSATATGEQWPDDALALAEALVRAGSGTGVITDGARGAVAVDGERAWVVTPAPIEVVSPVGSGDAFAAGLAAGVVEGRALSGSLVTAAAAGAANAATLGAGRFAAEDLGLIASETAVWEAGT